MVVTSGATAGLYATLTALVQPGDEVVLFEPCYDSYVPVIRLSGGTPVFVSLRYPDYAVNWDEVRRFMWNYVGIVRTTKRLERAQHRIRLLREEIYEYYANFRITPDLLELRNLVEVASLIVNSALSRRESRGLHFSRDYPETLPKALPSVLQPDRK